MLYTGGYISQFQPQTSKTEQHGIVPHECVFDTKGDRVVRIE